MAYAIRILTETLPVNVRISVQNSAQSHRVCCVPGVKSQFHNSILWILRNDARQRQVGFDTLSPTPIIEKKRMLTEDDIKNALKAVHYPGYSRDVVSFGLVKQVAAREGAVSVSMQLTGGSAEIAH